MKICFLVFSDKKGLGGHYRSLKETSTALRTAGNDTSVINIGESPSPVLTPEPNFIFLRSGLLSLIGNLFIITREIKRRQIDVIHSFDSYSYLYARIVSYITSIPSIYTKAGGKNDLYTPKSLYTTLFTEENRLFLQQKHSEIRYYVIPNRVGQVQQNLKEGRTLSILLQNKVVFLRISRIDDYYLRTNLKSIRFVSQYIAETKTQACFLLIGKVYNKAAFNIIKENCHDLNVELIHLEEDKFTRNASEFLHVASFIFGTGRGAMEALSLKKLVLSPTDGSDIPQLITPENFHEFLFHNFSDRTRLSVYLPMAQLINIMANQTTTENIVESNYQKFLQYCHAKGGVMKYILVYSNAIANTNYQLQVGDLIYNLYKYIHRNLPFRETLKKILS